MLRNYLRTAFRAMRNAKSYTAVNIIGLTTGMTIVLLIGLWVHNEYSYDRDVTHYSDLYQLMLNFKYSGGIDTQVGAPLQLVPMLRDKTPGVKDVVEADGFGNHGLIVGQSKLYLQGGQVGDEFLKMFDFPLLEGNRNTAFADINSIVLTQSTAKALFGNADPMGKSVRVDQQDNLKVSAILKDLPRNSSFNFNYLLPFRHYKHIQEWDNPSGVQWNNSFLIYVQLEPNTSYDEIYPKIKDLLKKNSTSKNAEVFLFPMKKWALYSNFENGKSVGGFIEYVRMFSIIGALVLLIACINFTNLSTARSEKRAREVGVRKAIGSSRANLIFQFLIESLLTVAIALLLAICLVNILLPAFNALTGNLIVFPYSSPAFWGIMAGFLLFTTLLAGSRPAFYMSAFRPIKVLKGSTSGKMSNLPRRILVVLQFTCSIALIIGTIIVYQQIQHIETRPTGYNPNRLMMTSISQDLSRNFPALRQDLLNSGVVTDVTKASGPVTGYSASWQVTNWPGKRPDQSLEMAAIAVSENYFKTVGMQIVGGRDFQGSTNADSMNLIINEAAVKKLGLKSPLDQSITWGYTAAPMRVIGVVRDAVITSPLSPAEPMFFISNPGWEGTVLYRLNPTVNTQTAIRQLSAIFDKYNPGFPYIYDFADEAYARKFSLQVLIGKLVGIFAILAILLSCMGLFSLATYVGEQRTKEIGIRKVLGATVPDLWFLLTRDFILLVGISCIIATPVAWYFSDNWLNNYAYRIRINGWIFASTYLLALVVTVCTISFETIKASIANPIRSIRTE